MAIDKEVDDSIRRKVRAEMEAWAREPGVFSRSNATAVSDWYQRFRVDNERLRKGNETQRLEYRIRQEERARIDRAIQAGAFFGWIPGERERKNQAERTLELRQVPLPRPVSGAIAVFSAGVALLMLMALISLLNRCFF